MDRRSLYQILEIPVGATEKEIRKAYRRLAMKYHPDRNPGDPEAEEKFKEAQRAYETLTGGSRERENHRVTAPRWGFDDQSSDLGDPFLGFFMAMKTLFPGDQKMQHATRNKRGGVR